MHSGRLVAFVAMLIVALTVSANAPSAAAGTIAVNCATGSLQNKIDNASPGTVILVKGTCHGNFLVPKNLAFKGNPSAILDGGGAGTT